MKIIINDANILIDLFHLDLLDMFFKLKDFDIRTTDFVFNELYEEQKEVLKQFVETHSFQLIESNERDLQMIFTLFNETKGLSIPDCSVMYFANKEQGILLTGDGKLRSQSLKKGVEVKGILYIFDILLLSELISFEMAIYKIEQLYQKNQRLPQKAKTERLECWLHKTHFISHK